VQTDLSGVKVLVVDDEADARELVKQMLTEFHADVHAASSADEALDAIRSLHRTCS
jgi:CheY-like chemotaxis protein